MENLNLNENNQPEKQTETTANIDDYSAEPREKMSKRFLKSAFKIVMFFVILFIVVIVVGVVVVTWFSSSGGNRNGSRDVMAKEIVRGVVSVGNNYYDENSSYKGFILETDYETAECSGNPIINISKDNKHMAVFMKSCVDEEKYFCSSYEENGNVIEVDTEHVKSGAANCN